MNVIGNLRLFALGATLVVAAVQVHALTLGRVRGAALIGRPLSLTVPVTLDATEQEACVQAEVFQGDTRMSGVAVRNEGSGPNQQLRITSSAVIDEPVVTVYLRVGCRDQVTRRYVVLAEHADESASAPLVPPRAVGIAPPAVTAAPSSRAPARSGPRGEATGSQAPRSRRSAAAPGGASPGGPAGATQAPATAQSPATAAAGTTAGLAAPAGRSAAASRATPELQSSARKTRRELAVERRQAQAQARLKLEPLDLSIDYAPTLRVTSQLRPEAVDGTKRAQAAALWQALNTAPEDMLRQVQRIEQMEKELGSLRSMVQQNAATVGQVGQQLQKARTERNWLSTLSVLLVGALLIALGFAYWVWRRGGGTAETAGRWWQGRADDVDSTPPVEPIISRKGALAPAPRHATRVEPAAQPLDSLDSRPPSRSRSAPKSAVRSSGPGSRGDSMPPDFLPSQTSVMRMVKAEELIDIEQQAQFFVSIGQDQEAMRLLEAHVHDHVETSPVAWLDLLEMYHRTGRRDDYERIRAEFHSLFNAQVPEFENFEVGSAGLEEYRRAVSRIIALWPSPKVLEVIEESIFRKPGTPGAEPFDVAAYRDLLLLYNIARDIVGTDDGTGSSLMDFPEAGDDRTYGSFASTNLQPLSGMTSAYDRTSTFQAPDISTDGGLDIDLGALEPAPLDEPIDPVDLLTDAEIQAFEAAREAGTRAPQLPDINFDFDNLPPKRR